MRRARRRWRAGWLASFVEDLQHGGEELGVRGDDVAALHVAFLAGEVADEPARLAHEERARGHVPGREAELPEAVDAPGRDPREVERGGAGPADAGGRAGDVA